MEIQSFIFLDIETTGLIEDEQYPKITEIAMVAVLRSAVMVAEQKRMPRVMHKVVIPVNPLKHIPRNVSKMTNLTNTNLRGCSNFDTNVYNIIMNFISSIKGPLCFISYNGKNFDFPILLHELSRINKDVDKSLADVMCIDSFEFFKNLYSNSTNQLLKPPHNFKLGTIYQHIFGKKAKECHSAEADCLNMLLCIRKYGKEFVEWTNKNILPINNFKT